MKTIILALFIFNSLLSVALARSEKLTIGCTMKCSILYRIALKLSAKQHHHNIRIVDLSKEKSVDLGTLDGILIPGGADIDPRYYFPYIEDDLIAYTQGLDHLVNYSEEGRKRDPFEFALLQNYFKSESSKNLPILGICRGMQMLAISQGIPLYVDIKTEIGIRNRRYLFDRIVPTGDPESLMNEFFSHSFMGWKLHHQGIRVNYFQKNIHRWPHLKITSFSNSGKIAESLEFADRPILGTQFHPEYDLGEERHDVFEWFLKKAAERFDSRR